MQISTKMCVTFICTIFIYALSEASSFHMCGNRNESLYSNSVNIASAGFPTTEEQTGCSCSITADTNLTIVLKVLITSQHDEKPKFPLEIRYKTDGRTHTVNDLKTLQSSLQFEEDEMIVAQHTNDINIELKEFDINTTHVNFVLQIKTSAATPEQINVKCEPSGKTNGTKKKQDENDDNEVLDYIEDLCSPHLVILLTSLSVALLIIILIVSIILCCVIPKKQRKKIEKIRQSMLLLENDTTFTVNNTDRIRPETRLYEDPEKAIGFNNTLTVPSPQQYANTNAQYRQSNLYQNI